MKHPVPQLASILMAQLRHKTGEIAFRRRRGQGDYDLVVLASPTWWFQTSMPIRSYLESPDGEDRAETESRSRACRSRAATTASTSGSRRSSVRRTADGSIDKTHFVVAGGQVKSMLSWLGYMKHGEPQERVFGLKMPPPNLKPTSRSRRGPSATPY